MAGEVTIRELTGFEAIATIYPMIQQLNPEVDEATFRERLCEMLEEGGYRCIAAYRDGAMVGVSGFWVGTAFWCGRYVEPDNVVVDQALRGSGIGQALMGWIEAEGNRLGCSLMKLEAYAKRTKTREFYRKQGFEEPGVVMIKALQAAGAQVEAIRAKASG